MTGSSWKSNLDPQIAARNRWADHHGPRPSDVAAARDARRHMPGARNRGLAVAAGVALTVAAVVLFFVVALHSSPPTPLFTTPPAAPAQHAVTADPAEHMAAADGAASSTAAGSVGGGGDGHAAAQ